MKKDNIYHCDFCGLSDNVAELIVVSLRGDVCICDACIEKARDVLGHYRKPEIDEIKK